MMRLMIDDDDACGLHDAYWIYLEAMRRTAARADVGLRAQWAA
jgi:hypothetical protein